MTNQTESYRGYTLYVHPEWTEFVGPICFIQQSGLSVHRTGGATAEVAVDNAKKWVDYTLGPLSKYGLLDALNDLADVQFINNTITEAEEAKAEVTKIIRALFADSF